MTPDALAALKHRRLLTTSKGRIKLRQKLRGIPYPSSERLTYLRALNDMFAELEREVLNDLRIRTDAIGDRWSQRYGELREKLNAIFSGPRVTWLLTDLARRIENHTTRGFQAQVAPVIGVVAFSVSHSERLRELFIHDNTRLIKNLPSELIDKIEAAVIRATRMGTQVRELEKEIQEKLSLSKQRAQLIARDQVSKYSGELTRHHQAAAGINKYRWETSRDERVREEHRRLHGQVFTWDKPPVSARNGGRYHPRAGFNCRCDAIPVIG